jgi:hypothetical protein
MKTLTEKDRELLLIMSSTIFNGLIKTAFGFDEATKIASKQAYKIMKEVDEIFKHLHYYGEVKE